MSVQDSPWDEPSQPPGSAGTNSTLNLSQKAENVIFWNPTRLHFNSWVEPDVGKAFPDFQPSLELAQSLNGSR